MTDETLESTTIKKVAHYPLRYAVIGIILHVAIFCIIGLLMITIPGRGIFSIALIIISWLVITGLFLGISMFKQILSLRTISSQSSKGYIAKIMFPRSKEVAIAEFLILTLLIFIGLVVLSFHNVSKILNWADLATLPKSASNVHVYTEHFMLSAEDYLRFKAKPEDIEKFLTDSPALQDIKYKTYSKDRMRLAATNSSIILAQERNADPNHMPFAISFTKDGHEYFYSVDTPPTWFKNEIRGAGRYYNFSKKDSYMLEELIVDDEKHIVYISRIRVQ